jgi:hypothetical protein
MAPRKLFIFILLSLSLALVLSSCLPIPFSGNREVLSPEDTQATVQVGIEHTLTAQRRIQAATNAARESASQNTSLPLDELTPTPAAVSGLNDTLTPEPTQTSTQPATATITPTRTITATHTEIPPTQTLAPTETPLPTATIFDPNTATPTPPPTVTPIGYQAPPATPVPPTRKPTNTNTTTPTPTPQPEAAAVLLQVDEAVYCRSGPGRSYDLIDALLPGEWAEVTGRSRNANYYVIETPRGTNDCWLWSRSAEIEGDIETVPYQQADEPAPPLPMFAHTEDNVCRAGPAESYPMLATLRGNTSAEIIGRTETNDWLLVRLPLRWVTCWAPGENAQLTGNLQAAAVLRTAIPGTGEVPAADPNPTEPAETPAQPAAVQPVMTPVAGTACRIMSQSPSPNTTISPNASFEASWTIRNIGSNTWESGLVDIHYLAGTRIHRSPDRFDLPQSIYTGESVTIKLQMMAPANPGRYNLTWAMSSGDVAFCAMPLTLEVR